MGDTRVSSTSDSLPCAGPTRGATENPMSENCVNNGEKELTTVRKNPRLTTVRQNRGSNPSAAQTGSPLNCQWYLSEKCATQVRSVGRHIFYTLDPLTGRRSLPKFHNKISNGVYCTQRALTYQAPPVQRYFSRISPPRFSGRLETRYRSVRSLHRSLSRLARHGSTPYSDMAFSSVARSFWAWN